MIFPKPTLFNILGVIIGNILVVYIQLGILGINFISLFISFIILYIILFIKNKLNNKDSDYNKLKKEINIEIEKRKRKYI